MDCAAPSVQQKTTIKVSMNGDTRRMQLTLLTDDSSDSGCEQTFAAIRRAVARGYDVAEDSLSPLKYYDEDSDLCTLAACTVPDLLVIANGGPLRLVADAGDVSSAVDTQKEQEEVQAIEPEAETKVEEESTVLDAATAETAHDVAAAASEEASQPHTQSEEELAVEGAAVAKVRGLFGKLSSALLSSDRIGRLAGMGIPAAAEEQLTVSDAATAETAHDIAAAASEEATQPRAQSEEELEVAGASVAEVLSSDSIGRLVDMGFPEDAARTALAVCHGDEAQAMESLLGGGKASPNSASRLDFLSGLHNLLLQVKSRLTELREQLRPLQEAAARHWERRHEHREHAQEEGRRRLEQLQASIVDLRAKLWQLNQASIVDLRAKLWQLNQEWQGSAQGAAEQVRAQFEERVKLEKLDAQLEDAQQFLGDTLIALQGRTAGILQRVFSPASNAEATEEEQAVAAVDGAEAAEAVAAASESAALAAIDTVDEFLVGMDDLSDGQANPRMRALSQGAAQAQDFLARKYAKMHVKVSEIFRGSTGSTGSTENTGEASEAPLSSGNDAELAPQIELPMQEGTPSADEAHPEDAQEAPEDDLLLVDAVPNESSTDQPSA